jgi:cytochrome c oxidase cbb3-type subunit 3
MIGLFVVAPAVAAASWRGAQWWTEVRLVRADPDAVPRDPALNGFAVERGRAAYVTNCQSCHGPSGRGDFTRGVPDLSSGHWLYGDGTPAAIERTVTYGVRSRHPKAWNLAAMPAYGHGAAPPAQTGRFLAPREIDDLAEFLIKGRGDAADREAAARGGALYAGAAGCYDCHAPDARGDPAIGAPTLIGKSFLYGDGSRAALADSITYGRQGLCPAWIGRLAPARIREVSLYVYALQRPSGPGPVTHDE